MQNGRKRLITAIAGLAIAGTLGLAPTGPAQAEPEIKDVKAKVERLYHEAEQASERYNDARLELEELDREVASLRADQRRQDKVLDRVRDEVASSIVSQYTGQGVSAAGQVLVSEDPASFLEQLTTMSAYQDVQADMLSSYVDERDALQIRREATEKRVVQVTRTKKKMAAEKAAVEKKKEEAEALLERLEAEEREQLLSRGSSTRLPSSVDASGRAGAALKYAMAQVGDAYVYGAAGPNAFDCSGLTMMAWAQAGVSLPHSSAAQFATGAKVAESDLRPGDLVFYYSPISHVGLYLGNGMIVHAANPGAGVVVSPLHSMPYVGAVRPG